MLKTWYFSYSAFWSAGQWGGYSRPPLATLLIISESSSTHYIGCSKTEFKTRYYNHTHSFRYREKTNPTELSKAFWNAEDSGHEPVIKWFVADRATANQPGSRSCNLCLRNSQFFLLTKVLRSTKDQS